MSDDRPDRWWDGPKPDNQLPEPFGQRVYAPDYPPAILARLAALEAQQEAMTARMRAAGIHDLGCAPTVALAKNRADGEASGGYYFHPPADLPACDCWLSEEAM